MVFEGVAIALLTNFLKPEIVQKICDKLRMKKRKPKIEINDIRKFWKICGINEYELKEGTLITIKGTISKYAPMIVGDPKKKRELHKQYRKELVKEKVKQISVIDPMLSLTSGNTVWRIKPIGEYIYLGLYQGIARNSVPVFVEKDYYYSIEGIFFKNDNPYCVDVILTGILGEFPPETTKKIDVMGEGPIYGLFVGGEETRIQYVGEASYLDADIWVALRYKDGEHMVSRFLDLGDIEDFENEREKLKEDTEDACSMLPEPQIILQFDQVHRLISVNQTIEIEDCWKKFWNKLK